MREWASHSFLSNLFGELIGQPKFEGDPIFYQVGHEIHRQSLEPTAPLVYTIEDLGQLQKVESTVNYLNNLKLFQDWVKHPKALIETTHLKPVFGAPFKGILDIQVGAHGIDLKTTSATSEDKFFDAAILFKYFRQAASYIRLANLDKFTIIAVTKVKPHKHFIIDTSEYPEILEYFDQELEFLIHLYKNYYDKETARLLIPGSRLYVARKNQGLWAT